ncbi:MAG: RHS repeat-associated core domain-containing protein [Planctomycetota bacterium]
MWGVVLAVALAAVLLAVRSPDTEKKDEPGTTPNQTAADARSANPLHDRLAKARELYDSIAPNVPESLEALREDVGVSHEVPVDEALREMERLQGVVDSWERRDLPPRLETPERTRSRTFAPWSRLSIEGFESPQEMDTDQSTTTGPEEEILVHNGEIRLERKDFSLPARGGVGFSFARVYRSHVDYDGPLGPGWDHIYNQRIIVYGSSPETASKLDWLTGLRRIRFERDNNVWRPERGAFYAIQVDNAEITVKTPTLRRFRFERAETQGGKRGYWRLRSITSRHDSGRANVVTCYYRPDTDLLTSVVDPYGNRVLFSYDGKGRLLRLRHGSVAIEYDYDAGGRLVAVTRNSVALSVGSSEDVVERYSYVEDAQVRHWLAAVIPPGAKKRHVFEHNLSVDSASYGRVTAVRVTENRENPRTLASWSILTDHDTETGDFRITVSRPSPQPVLTYRMPASDDAPHLPFPLPASWSIPNREATWQYAWNKDGLLTEIREPLGGVVQREYDSDNENPLFRGNLLTDRRIARPGQNKLGIKETGVRWEYHPEIAAPTSEVSYEVRANGGERVLRRHTWKYDPDSLDVVEDRIANQAQFFIRNRYGLVVAEYDSRGSVTLSSYYDEFKGGKPTLNGSGLLAEVIQDAKPDEVLQQLKWAGLQVDLELPERNVPVEPVERRVTHDYDALGRIMREKHPYYETRTVHNKIGDVLCRYDTRSDLEVWEYYASLDIGLKAQRTSFLADASYQGESLPGIKGRLLVQEFAHDSMGRLTEWSKTLERMGPNEDIPKVTYEHYPSGDLLSRTTPGGVTVRIVYDEKTGFLSRKELVAGDGDGERKLVMRENYRFDKEGFLRGYTDDLGEEHDYKPDVFGREFSYRSPDGVEHLTFLDGLDRTSRSVDVVDEFGETRIVNESRNSFDQNDNLLKKKVRRLGNTRNARGEAERIDEWLTEREFVYDTAGNPTETRSWRRGAVTKYEYDGLGRRVWTQGPEGDAELTLYEGDEAALRMRALKDPRKQTPAKLSTVSLLDRRRREWLRVVVGTDGKPAWGRSSVTVYDTGGRQVAGAQPAKTCINYELNSLDLTVRQVEEPLDPQYGEETIVRRSQYDVDGHLIERTLENRAVAFARRGPKEEREGRNQPGFGVFELSVPQTTTWRYDVFGRLEHISFPDGREREIVWGKGSMAESITWRGEEGEGDERTTNQQTLQLDYDPMRRVTSVKEDSGRTVQDFEYDRLGHITEAVDQANPRYRVTVRRSFDSLGNLLDEGVRVRSADEEVETPSVSYSYDLPDGTRTITCERVEATDVGTWQKMVTRSDSAGRVVGISLDNDRDLCRYEYVGSLAAQKTLPSGRMRLDVDFSPLLEPVGYTFRDNDAERPLSRLRYVLNEHGEVAASAMTLREPQIEKSSVYEHDSHGQLVAEGSEGRAYEDLSQFRRRALTDAAFAGSYRSRWYRYDEAGNRKEQYRGIEAGSDEDKENVPSEDDIGRVFFSQGSPVEADSFVRVDEKAVGVMPWGRAVQEAKETARTQKDLASNRLGSVATTRRVSTEFRYDFMGRLRSYEALKDEEQTKWSLNCDELGRLISMAGVQAKDESEQTMRLRFAYDAFNRRVLKVVEELEDGGGTRQELTSYVDRNPALIRIRSGDDGRWRTTAQYAWGPGSQELLMAALPRSNVEDTPDDGLHRYFFHQDRMLNVFMCTDVMNGDVTVHDIASYWGFGENATQANVISVSSTEYLETGDDDTVTVDGALDGNKANWLPRPGAGRLTLELERPARIDQLTIWADKCPRSFRVYVVPEGEEAQPPKDRVTAWERQAKSSGWDVPLATVTDGRFLHGFAVRQRTEDIRDPYELLLGSKKGKYLVIVWDESESFSVREFDVTVEPRNPGSVAFAGAWLDKETGLYYHGARYRLPSMAGKFISPDPLGFIDGENLYAYARNDPLTWHDPEGEWAHIVIGAGVGGLLGGGGYMLQVWITGEEFSWSRLGIYTGAGIVAGGVGAATFGAASGWLGSGFFADLGAGALAGAAGGGSHGAISSGGTSLAVTGDIGIAMEAALRGGALGLAVGAVGGGLGGAAAGQLARGPWLQFIGNRTLRGLATSVGAGTVGGAGAGAVGGGYAGFQRDGWAGVLPGAGKGAAGGAAVGAVAGAAAFGIGKAVDVAQRRTWGKAREVYWRQEAEKHPEAWSQGNLARMQRNKAPQQVKPRTGQVESMHLHHKTLPQRSGLPRSMIDQKFNLEPMWPSEHQAIHFP